MKNLVLAVFVLLAGCGGGGDSVIPEEPEQVRQPPPPVVNCSVQPRPSVCL